MIFNAKYQEKEKRKHIVLFKRGERILSIENVAHGETITKIPDAPEVTPPTQFLGWRIEGKQGIYTKGLLKEIHINRDTNFLEMVEYSDNVIPIKPEEEPSSGYIKVTFDKGEHGRLLGHNVFQVRDHETMDLSWIAPSVVADKGWKFKGWDKKLNVTDELRSDGKITALYEKDETPAPDPDPDEPGIDPDKPGVNPDKPAIIPGPQTENPKAGYVRITFDPTQYGMLNGADVGKKLVYDVKSSLRWGDVKNYINPRVTHKDGYVYAFKGWDKDFPKDEDPVEECTYTAIFGSGYINEPDPNNPGQPYYSYVRITLDPTKDGSFADLSRGTKKYFDVYEEKTWSFVREYLEATEPKYKNKTKVFEKWVPKMPVNQGKVSEVTFVASYKAAHKFNIEYIVNGTVYDSEKVYAMDTPKVPVNPTAQGYTFKGWKVEGSEKTYSRDAVKKFEIVSDLKLTAVFEKDPENPNNPNKPGGGESDKPGIKPNPGTEKPEAGFVRIVFDPTADGRLNGRELGETLVFDVRSSLKWEDVKNLIMPNVMYKDNSKIFDKWSRDLPADGDQVSSAAYTAEFKSNPGIVIPNDPNNPGEVPTGHVRITLDPTGDGQFAGESLGSKQVFDVDASLTWKEVKNRITYRQPAFKDRTKVFDKWDMPFPEDGETVKEATYVAIYKQAKTFTVTYKVSGTADVTESVYLMGHPAKVPADPKISGYKFAGWQVNGQGPAYSKAAVEKFEIVTDMQLVAKLDKDPSAAKKGTTVSANKQPLIIKGKKTIKLTPVQQKDMADGKYSYMELTVKNVSVKVTPDQFRKLYDKKNLKTYFKMVTKGRKVVRAKKSIKKKIFKGKVYMLNMVISGKQMEPLNAGIASVGKVKAKTKFKVMKFAVKKAKKAKKKGKKAKKAFKLLKKGGLFNAIFDKAVKKVYFNTKGNPTKTYFGLVKIQPKKSKKAKKGKSVKARKARRAR